MYKKVILETPCALMLPSQTWLMCFKDPADFVRKELLDSFVYIGYVNKICRSSPQLEHEYSQQATHWRPDDGHYCVYNSA